MDKRNVLKKILKGKGGPVENTLAGMGKRIAHAALTPARIPRQGLEKNLSQVPRYPPKAKLSPRPTTTSGVEPLTQRIYPIDSAKRVRPQVSGVVQGVGNVLNYLPVKPKVK